MADNSGGLALAYVLGVIVLLALAVNIWRKEGDD